MCAILKKKGGSKSSYLNAHLFPRAVSQAAAFEQIPGECREGQMFRSLLRGLWFPIYEIYLRMFPQLFKKSERVIICPQSW